MELHFTFHTIVIAIIKLFLLMLTGYVLYPLRLVDDKFVDTMSQVLVKVLVPALIISKTIAHFSFTEYAYWWFIPLCAVLFALGGLAMGRGVFKLLKGFASQREFMCGCGFQNCGYLPMNLILFSFAGAMADKLLIYTFLYIMGFNIMMWSLAPLFLSGGVRGQFRPGVLFNAPVAAIIFSLVL